MEKIMIKNYKTRFVCFDETYNDVDPMNLTGCFSFGSSILDSVFNYLKIFGLQELANCLKFGYVNDIIQVSNLEEFKDRFCTPVPIVAEEVKKNSDNSPVGGNEIVVKAKVVWSGMDCGNCGNEIVQGDEDGIYDKQVEVDTIVLNHFCCSKCGCNLWLNVCAGVKLYIERIYE